MRKKHIKIATWTIGIPIAVAATAWGYYYFTKVLPTSKVIITATYSPVDKCSTKYPMLVSITNGSTRIIKTTFFDITVAKKGYSTYLTTWNYHYYSTDKIIPPGKSHLVCLVYPKMYEDNIGKYNPEELVYGIRNKSLIFVK